MDITRAYFISDLLQKHARGEEINMLAPNPRPVTEIPHSQLASLGAAYPHAAVEGAIIDLHYANSFNNEAKRLQIAKGRPILITTGVSGADAVKYYARHYELRTKVTSGAPLVSYSMKQGVLVLIRDAGGSIDIVDLYTEK